MSCLCSISLIFINSIKRSLFYHFAKVPTCPSFNLILSLSVRLKFPYTLIK